MGSALPDGAVIERDGGGVPRTPVGGVIMVDGGPKVPVNGLLVDLGFVPPAGVDLAPLPALLLRLRDGGGPEGGRGVNRPLVDPGVLLCAVDATGGDCKLPKLTDGGVDVSDAKACVRTVGEAMAATSANRRI